MPDGKTHKLVGATAGIGYAAYQAKEQAPWNQLIEIAGGLVGGYKGGQLPDVLEPAISSWHRGTAHCCLTGGGIISLRNTLMQWEKFCREKAENCKALRMIPHPSQPNTFIAAPIDPSLQLVMSLLEIFWRFAAGFVNGVAAGYVSHLALDAVIGPRSIPLLPSF